MELPLTFYTSEILRVFNFGKCYIKSWSAIPASIISFMFAAEQTGGHNEYLTPSTDSCTSSSLFSSYPCPTKLFYKTLLQNGLKGQSVFKLPVATTDWTIQVLHRLQLSEIKLEWKCQKSRLEVFHENCPHFLWPTSLWRFWLPIRDAIKASVTGPF